MDKKMIIVSACLAGLECRYDGKSNSCEKVIEMVRNGIAIPLCPEQLGGLATPRIPAEIVDDKVITKENIDVTKQFERGAKETLKIAKLVNANTAILKQRSPSCGVSKIYDGTFSGKVISGMGKTAELLLQHGIKLISEEDME
jgi:uncharacterized protein YbbK (DUF523 family)